MIWVPCLLFAALFLRAIWGWGKMREPFRAEEEEAEFREWIRKEYGDK